MTAAAGPPVAHGSIGPRMRGHAWGALRREWIKLLFQRRSYLIWAARSRSRFSSPSPSTSPRRTRTVARGLCSFSR